MRFLAFALLALGLVVCATGSFVGCQRLFAWNGRHPVEVSSLTPGGEAKVSLKTHPRVRYTGAVQVVFDRQGLSEKDGALVVHAKFPLVGAIRDDSGRAVVSVTGWLDPAEPPSVLYGQAHGTESKHLRGEAPPELMVERLIGPWPSGDGIQEISVDANLGVDRVGDARVIEARLVVYDDVLPTSIKVGFGVAVLGALAATTGGAMLSLTGIRAYLRRRGGKRRRPRSP